MNVLLGALGTREFVSDTMAVIEIYTSPLCGYCYAAKRLFDQKGVQYTEYDVLFDRSRKKEMLDRSEGRRTVPQIFIDSVGIGGFDQLNLLDRKNQLDHLLQISK